MIDFNELEEKKIDHFRGGEGYLRTTQFVDEYGKIMKSILEPQCSVGEHIHDTSDETIYVIEGTGLFTLDGKEELVHAGQVHYCKKGSTHSIKNLSNHRLVMFCVVKNV